jgi:acid phosphatase family membrane protein YuiD
MELDYGGDDESGVQEMQKELKERLGHLPAEVVAGAALGTLIGFISHAYGSKRRLWQFR